MADDEHPVVTAGRIGIAVVLVLFLWFVAFALFLMGMLTDQCATGAANTGCGGDVRRNLLIAAGVVFLGSGFVGWFVAGKRWMVLAPVVGVVGSIAWGALAGFRL